MVHLFAHVFACLRARRLSLALVSRRSTLGFLFWHVSSIEGQRVSRLADHASMASQARQS
jgi:hypothetical protein